MIPLCLSSAAPFLLSLCNSTEVICSSSLLHTHTHVLICRSHSAGLECRVFSLPFTRSPLLPEEFLPLSGEGAHWAPLGFVTFPQMFPPLHPPCRISFHTSTFLTATSQNREVTERRAGTFVLQSNKIVPCQSIKDKDIFFRLDFADWLHCFIVNHYEKPTPPPWIIFPFLCDKSPLELFSPFFVTSPLWWPLTFQQTEKLVNVWNQWLYKISHLSTTPWIGSWVYCTANSLRTLNGCTLNSVIVLHNKHLQDQYWHWVFFFLLSKTFKTLSCLLPYSIHLILNLIINW